MGLKTLGAGPRLWGTYAPLLPDAKPTTQPTIHIDANVMQTVGAETFSADRLHAVSLCCGRSLFVGERQVTLDIG